MQATAGTFLDAKDMTAEVVALIGVAREFIVQPSAFPQLSSDPRNSPSTLRIDYTCLCVIGNYPEVDPTTATCTPCPVGAPRS